ncbi:MAG: CCA tRNA nucleotidyltransferase [Phycisphaerae bacterium]
MASAFPPVSRRKDAQDVVRVLREAGHVALFAGGCVRDMLLGLEPKDWDVATDAPPGRVRELFRKTEAVGAAFGVVLVRHGRSVLEVATFRSEGPYADGRRPDAVAFTDARTDARRRDFTINGLFFDPVAGEVIDYVNGRADLESRTLRAIGTPAERFAEDHLRMLRAVRFAARFDLRMDPATLDAVQRHAPRLARISPERVGDEMRKILTDPTRVRGWRLLHETGLAPVVFRFLPEAKNSGPPVLFGRLAGDVSFGAALATAILDFRNAAGTPTPALLSEEAARLAAQACRQAMRTTNDEERVLRGVTQSAGELVLPGEPPREAKLKRFLAEPFAGEAWAFLRLLSDATPSMPRSAELEPVLAQLAQQEVAPVPFVTGDDLIARGHCPGPTFKYVLDTVYDEQLEHRLTDRQAALLRADELARGT